MRFALLLMPRGFARASSNSCRACMRASISALTAHCFETMKLVALNGHVSRIWHKFERTSYWDEHEQIDTIVFQSTTKSVGFAGSPNFAGRCYAK